jgi:hypothetical protein
MVKLDIFQDSKVVSHLKTTECNPLYLQMKMKNYVIIDQGKTFKIFSYSFMT